MFAVGIELKILVFPVKVVGEALSSMSITSAMSAFSGRHDGVKPKMKLFNQHLNNNNNETMKIKGL